MNHGLNERNPDVMKKLLSVLLAFILVFTISASVAEAPKTEKALPDEHTEETKETDRSFTIPVGVGIVYSVIIYKDSISIVFTPVRNKPAELGLKTLDFLTDVKEIKLSYKDGQSVVFPAAVEIKSYDVGTFVSLNLSLKTVRAVSDLFATESDPDKIAFVRSDGTEREMSLVELNQALSEAFDSAADLAARTGKAIAVFLKNLSQGIWIYAEETSASVGKALAEAGRWISESASSVSQSVNKLKGKAGEALDKTAGSLRDHLESAAETVKDIWSGLRGLLIFTMLRLKLR